MRCERMRELISLELDDQVSAKDLVALRRHLQECRACSVFAHDLRRVVGGTSALGADAAPVGFEAAVDRRLSDSRASSRHPMGAWMRSPRLLRPAGAFAAIVGAIAAVAGLQIHGVRVERERLSSVEVAVSTAGAQDMVLYAGSPLEDIAVMNLAARDGVSEPGATSDRSEVGADAAFD
ncbi:MAG: zf-HC2 domain-containing protein [Armatimonadetes bacterium]|nr:zf-HC2 domain-containing protein [Armatimonadota bacterium]